MDPNNDDNVKVDGNCYYDDTNNILSFYLLCKQIQVRVLDDAHNDILVDHYAYGNDYDIHVTHYTAHNNKDLVFMDDDDQNDVIVNHHASDSNHDVHINNNTHIKNNDNVIYYNDDENNNNHVNRCDIGMAQNDENNYSTSLVPCVLSSLGTTSIIDERDPVGTNYHYMIRFYSSSPTISSIRSFTSFTTPLYLSSLETSSSDPYTCAGCNSYNGDDTDLDLVPLHLSPITSIHLLLVPSSLEPTSLSSNSFGFSSNYGLVSLGYVAVALIASLVATSLLSLSSSLLSSTFNYLSVLDSSFESYWLSSDAYVLDIIGFSSNPNDVCAFVTLHQFSLVLLLESSHFLGCFVPITISLFPKYIAFKIYCDFNPISLVLMIILMIMGLCCFPGLPQLSVMNWDSIQDSIQVTSCTILISS